MTNVDNETVGMFRSWTDLWEFAAEVCAGAILLALFCELIYQLFIK